jgi:hypothetical protein
MRMGNFLSAFSYAVGVFAGVSSIGYCGDRESILLGGEEPMPVVILGIIRAWATKSSVQKRLPSVVKTHRRQARGCCNESYSRSGSWTIEEIDQNKKGAMHENRPFGLPHWSTRIRERDVFIIGCECRRL